MGKVSSLVLVTPLSHASCSDRRRDPVQELDVTGGSLPL